MQNPFKQDGEMLPIASINSVYVENELAYNLFRPSLLLEDFNNCINEYKLSNIEHPTSVVYLFDRFMTEKNHEIKERATHLARKYGYQLGQILATLFQPSDLSKKNRKNWTDAHWDYWSTVREIILVGGLTSPLLVKIFKEEIDSVFDRKDIQNKTITFIEGSQNMGTSGLASIVPDGDVVLFDFGQTSIKRGRVVKENHQTISEMYLTPIQSKFLDYKDITESELQNLAKELDDFMAQTILQTIQETGFSGSKIYMSIANYVYKGKIFASRGGYGKLALITENYQRHIEKKLQKIIHKDIEVQLFHDTSAMALHYRNKEHTAVISLGTAFGVAFPDDSLYS